MDMYTNDMKQEIYKNIKEIVYTILHNENIFKTDWHLGKVESVISPTLLNVFVDGSNIAQKIPCNPKVQFSAGDEVFVLYINGKSTDKFVPFHRGILP
jgi:hypothetical protein